MADRRQMPRTRALALVLAAAAVFFGVPLVLTARPAYFGSVEGLASAYDTWSRSTHAEARCEACHVQPTRLARAVYRARLVGEFYTVLLAQRHRPSLFAVPTNEACQACHEDLRSVSPSGDLRIPHRAHVAVLKMRCVECHDDQLVHAASPEGERTPPMAGCLRCHNGDVAKDACSACHTEKNAPPSHRSPDWLRTHAQAAKDPGCDSCHRWTEDWCADCHTRRPASHGDDWRKRHRDAVASHRNCEACHDGPFCVRCHGEVPQQNIDRTRARVR